MAWSRLQPSILQGSRVIVDIEKSENRTKRSWADEFLNSLSSLACYEEPIPASKSLIHSFICVFYFKAN
jgi:hypothetical protein